MVFSQIRFQQKCKSNSEEDCSKKSKDCETSFKVALREKCPDTDFFLVCIFFVNLFLQQLLI